MAVSSKQPSQAEGHQRGVLDALLCLLVEPQQHMDHSLLYRSQSSTLGALSNGIVAASYHTSRTLKIVATGKLVGHTHYLNLRFKLGDAIVLSLHRPDILVQRGDGP